MLYFQSKKLTDIKGAGLECLASGPGHVQRIERERDKSMRVRRQIPSSAWAEGS